MEIRGLTPWVRSGLIYLVETSVPSRHTELLMGSEPRKSWIACPKCARMLANVRTIDAQIRCKRCGAYVEVVIRSLEKSKPDSTGSSAPVIDVETEEN